MTFCMSVTVALLMLIIGGGSGISSFYSMTYTSFAVIVPTYALAVLSSSKNSNNRNKYASMRQEVNPHRRRRRHETISSSSLSTTKLQEQEKNALLTTTNNIQTMESSESNTLVDENTRKSQRTLGLLVLLSVPLSWGTYAPVVRYVYEMNPPIPGIVFSAGYYIIAAVSLIGLELWTSRGVIEQQQQQPQQEEVRQEGMVSITNLTTTTTTTTAITTSWTDDSKYVPILGGMELGTYLFIGNLLQVIGLKTVPADRAAFLVQLTTIFVPLAQGIMLGNLLAIPGKTWIACLIAFLGVVVMGFDGRIPPNFLDTLLQALKNVLGSGEDSLTTATSTANTVMSLGHESSATLLQQLSHIFTGGDLLVVSAALAYTMHVLRLSSYVRKTTPLRLAGAKATVESLWSLGLVFVLSSLTLSSSNTENTIDGSSTILPSFICDLSKEITVYFSTVKTAVSSGLLTFEMWLPAVCACLWTGLITCAYTIYAQSYGQRRVDATEANLIYSAQPVFSSLFAWGLLGEKLGLAGFLGGSLIALALWLVTTSTSSISFRQSEDTTEKEKIN